jgi:iron(III) transport system permease protein
MNVPYLRLSGVSAVALVVIAPIALIIYQSVLNAPFYAPHVAFSLASYDFVFSDPQFRHALVGSIALAAGMVVIALPLGAALAILMTRTDLPGRRWFGPAIVLPLFFSSLVVGFGYIVSVGPVGFVTLWWSEFLGHAPWNLNSFPSMVVISGLTHVPYSYLYIAAALNRVNPEVEEAARVIGAGLLRTSMTVSLPLVRPAIVFSAMLIFLLGLEEFGLPLLLGNPSGIMVLTTYLFEISAILGTPSYQIMAVVAVVIMAATLPLVVLQHRSLSGTERFVTLRGKGAAHRVAPLGSLRWPATALVVTWLVLTVALPLAGIVLRSLVTEWGQGASLWANLTLQHFRDLSGSSDLLGSVFNTALVSTLGAAVSVMLYTGVALIQYRWQSRGSAVMDYLVMLPRAMPGLIAGLAFLWLFLFIRPLAPLRGTIISVWAAYTIVWLAYGTRIISGALTQVAPELEEAARTIGAHSMRVLRDITVPLVRPGIATSWLLIFLTFCREYSTAVYLMTSKSEVIGSLIVSLWNNGALDLVSALCVVNVFMILVGLAAALRFGVRLHA